MNDQKKEAGVPLQTERLLPYEGQASLEAIKHYQAICGSIEYRAIITRPDVTHAASKLAQFLQNPNPKNIEAAINCIRYLDSRPDLCIVFDAANDIMETLSDAASADNLVDQKSSQGFILKLFGGAVIYRAEKKDTELLPRPRPNYWLSHRQPKN